MTEAKRDLTADLALCDDVFGDCGWCTVAGVEGDDYFRFVVDVATDDGREPVAYTRAGQYARFIAEARAGWPEAIRRAIAAEERVQTLERHLKASAARNLDRKIRIRRLHELNDGNYARSCEYAGEIERLRAVLERMDDRKHPMMPRSQMARMAKEALDSVLL